MAQAAVVRAYRSLGDPLTAPLLDLGCGEGGMAGMLAALNLAEPPLCGIDLRLHDLTRAQRGGSHRHVVAGDARRLPFANGRFATVVANGVLCCLRGGLGAALVAEVHRVLRPGGCIVATVPTPAFAEVLLPTRLLDALAPAIAGASMRQLHRRLGHVSVLDEQAWRRLFEQQGLVIKLCEPCFSSAPGGLWSLLYSHPLRVFGVLRLPGLGRPGKALVNALFARAFARRCERDPAAGPPFGYLLIAARRSLTPSGDAAC